jgi:nucleotidyltransferase/DNA polymerase involved in DNA repair
VNSATPTKSLPRFILHLDMDAFYASVEVRENPEWQGKPVIVGYPGGRGVVSTCSYEARKFGVHSAMPSVTAKRLCPDAIWTHGRMGLYSEISRSIRKVMDDFSPTVEPLSIDEAFLDLTGIASDWQQAESIARDLQQRIFQQERLTSSVGVAQNKFLAKLASDMDKPNGITVMKPGDMEHKLWPLPVRRLWGVGPKMEERLQKVGIHIVRDLLDISRQRLEDKIGERATTHLRHLARGEDHRPVSTEHERKSISEERTYGEDLKDPDLIERALLQRAEGVSRALRRKHLETQTVQIKVRAGDFSTWTRAATLPRPTDLAEPIFMAAKELYEKDNRLGKRGVRLLGVGATNLVERGSGQALLFEDEQTALSRRRAKAIDAVREKIGEKAITRARLLEKREEPEEASSLPAVD